MISKVRGTQDVIDMKLFNFLVNRARLFFEKYNFHEISTPLIEHAQLYLHSLGQETDIVSKQMFMINMPDQEQLCLRPEATASTMRAFLEHQDLKAPWKVFSWGPMFRYERPQKGRYRQFHQFNIELVDAACIWYDAQLISMLDTFFDRELSLDSYALTLNFLGCMADRKTYKEALKTYLANIAQEICDTCKIRAEKNILRVLDCKQEVCKKLYEKAPMITDFLCGVCTQEWHTLKETLHMLSVSYTHVPTLVRGLDYYDKTVFEFVTDQLGAQSAFCSGGRYDNLAQAIGSDRSVPSVGAAIGLERLLLMLEKNLSSLSLPVLPAYTVILPLAVEQNPLALLISQELSRHNLYNDIFLENSSLKSLLRKSHKAGARYVLIIGDQEQKDGTVLIKDMLNATQEIIKQTAIVDYLK